jgi:DNA mismatch repair protein PMS2
VRGVQRFPTHCCLFRHTVMEQNDPSPARQISRIETSHVERLHAGQVIVDLSSIVKELLENALDAGATSIGKERKKKKNIASVDGRSDCLFAVIDLEQYGREVVVSDNGSGIAPSDFASLARKHHTSKLATFDDLDSVSSFGFRGEALAALANVCHLVVSTRRLCDGNGARLEFDVSGEVTSNSPVSHPVGTTVSVTEVFRNLPVRQEEYVKNLKREYAKLLPLIQSYMLICNNVKISLFNTALKRQLVFASSGKSDMRENAVLAFGSKEAKVLGFSLFFCSFVKILFKRVSNMLRLCLRVWM